MFKPQEKAALDAVVRRYERRQAALLPVLNAIQEKEGLVTPQAQKWAAEYLGVPLIKVQEVVSFYTLLKTRKTAPKHLLVCRNLPCALRGSEEILADLENRPGCGTEFTYESAECLGACEHAPVAIINKKYVGSVDHDFLDTLPTTWDEDLPLKVYGLEDPEKRLLTRNWDDPDSHKLAFYLKQGGYRALKKARKSSAKAVTEEVIASNLRGLGGAGFPCGRKWTFIPKTDKPVYLVVNADEGEPGTFKDRLIMECAPHRLIEGIGIAAHATGAGKAFIYIRGEYQRAYRILSRAVEEARRAKHIDIEIVIHRGAGAYICGEETGLLESLEGKKGWPRLKPPFPAVEGLFGCPTVVNNVETLSHLPGIIEKGASWFAKIGSPKNGGTRLFCVSGCVNRPGIYELPLGTSLREIIYDHAQGIFEGRELKGVIPGGVSASILAADEIDVPMDFDSLLKAGSMAGSGGIIVLDKSVDIVKALYNVSRFFAHESCGQCSPCREGTGWITKILWRILEGKGSMEDIDHLTSIATNIGGNTICALGDAAAMPVKSYIAKFRSEFEQHVREQIQVGIQ